jgi:osmotically inducible lipoprotein OsmB
LTREGFLDGISSIPIRNVTSSYLSCLINNMKENRVNTNILKPVLALALLLGLAGCGNTPGSRALSGGVLGAGAGAGISALAGGKPATGALIGGGVGAVGGAATAP